ncbi:MAG: citrate/2-methylcitrate synthase [Patescibacteria group bacterium]
MNIDGLKGKQNLGAVVFGNHPGIIQSTLDFDYLSGKNQPSIRAIIGVQRKSLRYFWGKKEIVLPGYISLKEVPADVLEEIDLFAVAQSGRRAISACEEAIGLLPNVVGGMVFAEGVTERHALKLRELAKQKNIFILGPASVGFLISGVCKIGAIGGTLASQITKSRITKAGSTAVISTSGGVTNELINMIAGFGGSVSFAGAIGGERYPILKPVDLVSLALNDQQTKAIVFFGEVGGRDEYEIAELLKNSANTKPLICYIAGKVAESFEDAPQFGHAKAMAHDPSETASAKRQVLASVGAKVADSFSNFEQLIKETVAEGGQMDDNNTMNDQASDLENRKHAMFVNNVSSDKGGDVRILGKELIEFVGNKSLSQVALSMFLGHEPKSPEFSRFFDLSLRLLVDHGPQVSGAVNTMVTARAGRDLTAGLATGLLTIGPRFGGAINQAAQNWLQAVASGESPQDFVERFASKKEYIAGIGHKKYRVDSPDPRVTKLLAEFKTGDYTNFALEVEKITSNKKAQLILNVDGLIGALTLDMLAEEEGYSLEQIKALVDTEFCNAIFVYARTVGFIAHYLDQKRLDEALFRLPDDQITDLQ